LPLIRVGSITELRASVAARGLMRNKAGAGDAAAAGAATGGVATEKAGSAARGAGAFGAATAGGAVRDVSGMEGAEAGAGAGAVTAGIASPGLPRKPTVLCTGTFTPGGTTIFSRVPASKLSTSMTDLSVSTENRMSPFSTLSPFFLSHSTMALSSVI